MRPASIITYETEDPFLHPDLDYDYIDGVAEDIARALRNSFSIDTAYQPGDGTFYGLAFTPLRTIVQARPRTKDGREWEILSCRGVSDGNRYEPTAVLVSWVENGAYPIRLGGRTSDLAASYVGEHLGTKGTSAVSISILLRAIDHHITRGA